MLKVRLVGEDTTACIDAYDPRTRFFFLPRYALLDCVGRFGYAKWHKRAPGMFDNQ